MAEEAGLQVDMGAFEELMEAQRVSSRPQARSNGTGSVKFEAEATAYLQSNGIAHTDDSPK